MYQAVYDQLCALEKIYKEILVLAREKQAALRVKDDHEALTNLAQREEQWIEQARATEMRRADLVRRIAKEAGVPAESLGVEALADLAGAPLSEALREKGKDLLALLRALQTQNELNRQILEINLSFAAFMMDVIGSETGPSSIYSASGDERDSSSGEIARLLDSEI